MTLSLMIPGLFSGDLQEAVGYRMFFIIVMLFCSVTFLVSALVSIDPDFGKKNAEVDVDGNTKSGSEDD